MKILKDMTILDAELNAKYEAEFMELFNKMDCPQRIKAFEYIKALVDKQHNDDKKTLN